MIEKMQFFINVIMKNLLFFRSLCAQSAIILENSLKEHAVKNKNHIIQLKTPNNEAKENTNISEQNCDRSIKEEFSDADIDFSESSDVWADELKVESDFEEVAVKKSRQKTGKWKTRVRKSLEESLFENDREISEMNMSLSELQKHNNEEKLDGFANEGKI